MHTQIFQKVAQKLGALFTSVITALVLGAGPTSANAGGVSSNFDPAFGPQLSGLSYAGSFSFTIADSVLGNLTDTHTQNLMPFDTVGGLASLTLSDGTASHTESFPMTVFSVKVINGAIVGWSTDSKLFSSAAFSTVPSAQNQAFGYYYDTGRPDLWCKTCGVSGSQVRGQYTLFSETVSHTNDKGFTSTVTITIDSNNNPVVSAVPEPASVVLMTIGLGLIGWIRRRSA